MVMESLGSLLAIYALHFCVPKIKKPKQPIKPVLNNFGF
jgi:hypothetical protein